MKPSAAERLKEIESRAVKLPNGKHLAVADSAVTEWLIQRVKTLEAAAKCITIPIDSLDGSCGYCYEYGPNGSSYPPENYKLHKKDCSFRIIKEALEGDE